MPMNMIGQIIAGPEDRRQVLTIRGRALAKCSTLKEWIEQPDTIPNSLRKNGLLCFSKCDIETVSTVIDYLERDDTVSSLEPVASERIEDPLFYVKVYKLANSLG